MFNVTTEYLKGMEMKLYRCGMVAGISITSVKMEDGRDAKKGSLFDSVRHLALHTDNGFINRKSLRLHYPIGAQATQRRNKGGLNENEANNTLHTC